eukprot:8764632-Pyramimonas_sp.AAC.1
MSNTSQGGARGGGSGRERTSAMGCPTRHKGEREREGAGGSALAPWDVQHVVHKAQEEHEHDRRERRVVLQQPLQLDTVR